MGHVELYQANGYYYWPEVRGAEGRYTAVVRFVCIEEHLRHAVPAQSDQVPGIFSTHEAALDAARAWGHETARGPWHALKWIWGR